MTITAASRKTIGFVTQNGQTVDGNGPRTLELPHLVLRRNGVLTAAKERTLDVAIAGLDSDPADASVTLELTTMHPDPDAGALGRPLVVERLERWTAGAPVTFTVTFGETTAGDALATPTDYYSVALTVRSQGCQSTALVTPYAFLLESQWVVGLPAASEEVEGAAPDSLVIYYTDMMPLQRVAGDPQTRLARAAVDSFVGEVLAPEFVEAFRLQSNQWGFAWHEAWTGFRGGEDAERLAVALSDGATWFHGIAPRGANSTLAINVNAGMSGSYATLADGIISVFHHELFHNLQRDLRQALAGQSDIDGLNDAWEFITEGMAVVAQSVARPDLEYSAGSNARAFFTWSNRFLRGDERAADGMNVSYQDLNPYEGTLYWRFLFEAAGGNQTPAAGMALLRNVLVALYSGEVVDIDASDDLVEHLPAIVTAALARTPYSPFATFQDSLRSFARSIYALRSGSSGGLYDPNHLLATPGVTTINYPPAPAHFDPQRLPAGYGIASSFGIDFVRIEFAPGVQGMPVEIEVRGAAGSAAEFDVQVLGIDAGGNVISTVPAADRIPVADSRGQVAVLALNETGEQLAGALVIIVRVDNREAQDGEGRYGISVRPIYGQL